jgi:GH15 family glucan-1,4-alpha-glucosidase
MNQRADRTPLYRPIEDYGLIGNLCSTALVRLDGSIDWCCLPHLDSPSVFAALLDGRKGGHFLVQPTHYRESSQHYAEATNVLVTVFHVEGGGRVEVWDYMPTGPDVSRVASDPDALELYRRIRCTHGKVEVRVVWVPRHDYARAETVIEATRTGFVALGGECPFGMAGLPEGSIVEHEGGPAVAATITLAQGEERFLINRWDDSTPDPDPKRAARMLEQTIDAWTSWLELPEYGLDRPWAGPFAEQVRRSELVLKLMTRRDSGALCAAPTTSLPETIGGVRNWDYRYTWIRDAAQIAQALFALGHRQEADAFLCWAEHVTCKSADYRSEGLQILYPLRPGTPVKEEILEHLEGYRGSAPVRIGNGAVDQLQLDVFGELLNAVYERVRLSDDFDADMGGFLRQVVDEACSAWQHPDYSIWEVKDGPRHHVYSKLMTWVALDRACWLSERGYLAGEQERWKEYAQRLREKILRYGFNSEINAFTRGYRETDLDASNLLIPLMEFLPPEDPRVQGTIDATLERLTVNDLVYRYRYRDGLPGEEGAFVLCTFWLVDALALSNRLDEAERIFENLVNRSNHLGLLAEQIDPYSGEFLGNFPQAYSHLGLINSSLYLAARKGREIPVGPLLGMTNDSS